MSMVKFSPIALNFGYDSVLLVHFLGDPVVGRALVISLIPAPPAKEGFLTCYMLKFIKLNI